MRAGRTIFAALMLASASHTAFAQSGSVKTLSELTSEINSNLPDNTAGQITPFDARQTLLDMVTTQFGTTPSFPIGTTITGGASGNVLFNSGGTLGNEPIANMLAGGAGITVSGSNTATIGLIFNWINASGVTCTLGQTCYPGLTVGTSAISGGTNGNLLYDNSGALGEESLASLLASPPSIGNVTPNSIAATTLSVSSTVSGTGFSAYFASPPPIGGTTPAAGAFTTLSATSLSVAAELPGLSSSVEGIGVPGLDHAHWFIYNAPSSLDTINTLRVDRSPSYTGGTSGDVYDAIWGNCSIGSGVANFEWCGLFQLNNFATGGQNVALAAYATKNSGAGPTFAINPSLTDNSGNANPTNGLTNEFNLVANGTDTNIQRIAADFQLKTYGAGTAAHAGAAVRFLPGAGTTFDNGVIFGSGGSGASFGTFINASGATCDTDQYIGPSNNFIVDCSGNVTAHAYEAPIFYGPDGSSYYLSVTDNTVTNFVSLVSNSNIGLTPNAFGGVYVTQGSFNVANASNFFGSITATDLATSGTTSGSVCATAAGVLQYIAGTNCFGGAGYAIGGLPTCNSGLEGAHAYVTNGQSSPSFLATVSATGSVIAPVFCNGSAWVYG